MPNITTITRDDNLYHWLDTINEVIEISNNSVKRIVIDNDKLIIIKNNDSEEEVLLNSDIVTSVNNMKGDVVIDDYVSSISISGKVITVTKKDGTTQKLTTQDTVYTLPTATSTRLGGVKIGENITNNSGTISVSKENIISAFGDSNPEYTVQQNVSTANNTYPILACATANATATDTTTTIFCKDIKINPSDGSITATAVYNAVWNDYAEFFPRGEETEPGDIIALSLNDVDEKYVKASKNTSKAIGVHSNTFGHLIGGEKPTDGQDFVEYNLPKFIPVGLCGRCYAKIVGKVKKGDFIVISDIPGVGKVYNKDIDDNIDIIGMACENSDCQDIKLIKICI